MVINLFFKIKHYYFELKKHEVNLTSHPCVLLDQSQFNLNAWIKFQINSSPMMQTCFHSHY